jgi:hypothetical protein
VLVPFAGLSWWGERESCLRQQLPRAAGNARKAAIDRLVLAVGPKLEATDRDDVVRLTRAVPTVPPLRCSGLMPATDP